MYCDIILLLLFGLFVAFREQIESPLVNFNITDYIVRLQTLNSNTNMIFDSNISSVIMQLETLRDTQIPAIMTQTVSYLPYDV